MLTKKKLDIQSFDTYFDFGLDSVKSKYEDGCGGKVASNQEYIQILEKIYVQLVDEPIFSCTDLDSGFDLDCENIFDIVWNEIPSGFIDSTYNFFPTDIDSLTILSLLSVIIFSYIYKVFIVV